MHPKTSRRQKERRDWGRFRLKVKPSPEVRTYLGSKLEDNSESETDAVLEPATARGAILYGHPVELDNANGHLVTGIHIHAATVCHREVIPTAVAEVRTAEKSVSKHGCFVCSMGGTGSKQVFHGITAVLILPTEVSHDAKTSE